MQAHITCLSDLPRCAGGWKYCRNGQCFPLLEAEAKERQLATLKQGVEIPVTERIPERDRGEARDKAAEIAQGWTQQAPESTAY